MNKIGIIGVGKLGLPYALTFESMGYDVCASSYKQEYVTDLKNKTYESTEPGAGYPGGNTILPGEGIWNSAD